MTEFFGTSTSRLATTTYREQLALLPEIGAQNQGFDLGSYSTRGLFDDPKRFGFLFARHKFVGKMLDRFDRVLEVGCHEGLGSIIVAQAVKSLVSVDFYRPYIDSCQSRLSNKVKNIDFRGHDIIDGPVEGEFDGAFSMDVIEHIDPAQEDCFMRNISVSLRDHGALILGTPSLESQRYASPSSAVGHINCKSGDDFRRFCQRYYHTVFMFGMNDEVVHTGFLPMCHYLIALCVSPRREPPS